MGSKIIFISILLFIGTAFAAGPKWQANIPTVAKEATDWVALMDKLNEKNFHYGSLSASFRVLIFFNDLETKEKAYRTIISLADEGYPFPIQPYFQTGDLTPSGDYEFVNSYNLYKFILNHDKKLEKWAKNYLEGIDKDNFEKFTFFQAIEAYSKKDFKTAEEKLKSILQKDLPLERAPFVKKVARTLARVYFDQEQYAKSYDIYSSFLLKTELVTPNDWLESAWSLYYLKRYQESLGMLYNLESKSQEKFITLEKFTIRALIYRNLCAVQNAETLIDSFQKEFGEAIRGIKRGEPLRSYPVLEKFNVPESMLAVQMTTLIEGLKQEQAFLKALPSKLVPLANYLYQSEIQMLTQKRKAYYSAAMEAASGKLILMDENLRFLKFDVQREKYNPETVFKPVLQEEETAVEEMTDNTYRIRWVQAGDYWRDERNKYRGILPNRCSE